VARPKNVIWRWLDCVEHVDHDFDRSSTGMCLSTRSGPKIT
jgi:hypothetical protein